MIGWGVACGSRRFPAVMLTAIMLLACGDAPDPGAGSDAEQEQLGGGGALTVFTDRTELFFEHPPLIAGQPSEPWAIHFTDLSDFGAVTVGRLTLSFSGSGGHAYSVSVEAPVRAGVYSPSVTLPAPGRYDLRMRLEGSQVSDDVVAGIVLAHASEGDLPPPEPEPDVGITFLKEQQWPIDFATVLVGPRAVSPGFEVTGELDGTPGGLAEIAAPVEGIVRWDLNRAAPAEGSLVEEGDPVVRLSPVSGEDTYAALRARQEELQREVERTERLVAAQAVPARRLEEARLALTVVQAQLEALDVPDGDGYTLTLRTPISGSIIQRDFVTGQRVEAGAPLLTVLDSRRLRLRLHVPAARADALQGVVGATFAPEGSTRVYRTGPPFSVGVALDPERRTVPVAFEVDNRDGGLRAGMIVNGRILTATEEPAPAVPAEAVVDQDGTSVVYVQLGGESFERRTVTVGATDGEWTTLLSGVSNGERVVTRGQYQIRLASLETSELADHGHPH